MWILILGIIVLVIALALIFWRAPAKSKRRKRR